MTKEWIFTPIPFPEKNSPGPAPVVELKKVPSSPNPEERVQFKSRSVKKTNKKKKLRLTLKDSQDWYHTPQSTADIVMDSICCTGSFPLKVGYLQQPSAETADEASRIFVCAAHLLKTD